MSGIEGTERRQIVVFALDEPRYALPLSAVERVIRAVEITPLPKAPEIILGVINAQGQVIPVVDVRRRFRLPAREMNVADWFILARTSRRQVALVVDSVIGARELAEGELVSAENALPYATHLQGVVKTPENLILIYDLERFLSLDEVRLLDTALAGGPE